MTAAQGADSRPDGSVRKTEEYTIVFDYVRQGVGDKGNWFQPRPTAIPKPDAQTHAIMTVQRALPGASDYFSGFSVTATTDSGKTWSSPELEPALGWRKHDDGITEGICDFTLGYHAPTGKVLAIGHSTRYRGSSLAYRSHGRDVMVSVYDPTSNTWSLPQRLDLGDRERHFICGTHGQWLAEPDGSLLIPVYYTDRKGARTFLLKGVVVRCSFDGEKLVVTATGKELNHPVRRGLYEKSLTFFKGRYYMTMRNDQKGYVAVSDDGLTFEPHKTWVFDDGKDLGSYNTQQKWVTHSDALYLVYTRRGAGNDHIARHRAPLFMAKIDPERLCVLRATEQIVVPERGYAIGNFDATTVSDRETWITVGGKKPAPGFHLTRIQWKNSNQLAGRVN
ncbi:MAG: exo-alpha-sialidase [Lentisphaeria bacterium]|nr:exo-alpha-sialidase [Lentisphaeria bacterium]